MKKLRIAINGFGRIGRLSLRAMLDSDTLECVAINDLTDNKTLAHLLKYDSVHGRFPLDVKASGSNILIGEDLKIKCFNEKDPAQLPWKEMEIDMVLESTGRFRTKELAGKHLEAGAKKVILSAPGRGGAIPTVVFGVNHEIITKSDNIISNASCTTNCLAPMAKVIDDNFGIVQGFMTTVHAYTADQNLMDAPHKDLRRARAAGVSIIPTTTGAASATEIVLPHLKGKLSGSAMRVPTICGSATEFTFLISKKASAEDINTAIRVATGEEMKGIIEYTEDPIVSSDIIGNPHSCIFDGLSTDNIGQLYKVLAWYDNEFAYSVRLVDIMDYISNL